MKAKTIAAKPPIKPVTESVSDLSRCVSDLESLLSVFKSRQFRTVCL